MPRVLTPIIVLTLFFGCSQRAEDPKDEPRSKQRTATLLSAAVQAKDPGKIYDLLDRQSRWSMISVHKDLRRICSLVKTYYPSGRRARELERCADAFRHREPRAYMANMAWTAALLAPLSSGGAAAQGLCKRDNQWSYCGLGPGLTSLKLKTARDLATTRENADTFGRQ